MDQAEGKQGPEDELAVRLRAGCPRAWLEVYDAHAAPLWRHVARLMGASDEGGAAVADVVQATLLSAAESAGGFDSARGSVWRWLCGIARNQMALYYRRRGPAMLNLFAAGAEGGEPERARGTVHNEPCPLHPGSAEADDPGARVEAGEMADLVRRALRGLSEEYQVLLLARYVDGFSAEQIAEAEESTGQAMRSKLARARRAFHEQLVRLAPSLTIH